MDPDRLSRGLRRLKRTIEQLGVEFAEQRVDEGLLAEIDLMRENGLGRDPRTARLMDLLEELRQGTLSDRAERYGDGLRNCRRVKAEIEGVLAEVG